MPHASSRTRLRACLLTFGFLLISAPAPLAQAQALEGQPVDAPPVLAPPVAAPPTHLPSPLALSQPTQLQYLSGLDKDNTVPWNFICNNGNHANVQTTIPVPSSWELQGFGTYVYQGLASPTVKGVYTRTFSVPASFAGQRIVLVFEGVQTETTVLVNGKSAGATHEGGFYRFTYDVTTLVNTGPNNSNSIEVDVNGDSTANTSINQAEREGDYWNFSGIFRPVYLEAFPPQSIERVAVNAKADGTFTVDAYLNGITTATTVSAQIEDLSGNPVGAPFSAGISSGSAVVRLATTIPSPLLWTAETPNLYQVVLSLSQGATVLHTVPQTFGFRTMEVRAGDGLYVNGKRVLLKGSNRHSFWPDSGRCLSDAISRQDIGLMRGMNMNAVRMSHYPPDQHFLDECDAMGLYVLDELGGWQHAYDNTVGPGLVQQMVVRDVNHPSILIWDNANEGGWNTALDPLFDQYDPQGRPVNHPGGNGFDNIYDTHYPSYSSVQTSVAGGSVYLPTEFLHGNFDGGAGAGLSDYWDLFRQGKVTGGGFIWAFLDEGVVRTDKNPTYIDVSGNSAPDGIMGPYRQPEGSTQTIKEVWSPIVFTDATLPSGSTPTLHLDNRYDFLDLQQCGFVWELRQFARPRDGSNGYTVLAQGTVTTGSIPARTSGTLTLSLPGQLQAADALAVHALDPAGNEVWTKVWTLPNADAFRTAAAPAGRLPVTATDTATAILVRSNDLAVTISKTTGQLTAVNRAGHAYSLANGPRLVTGTATLTGISHQAVGGDQVITATYSGNMQSVTWYVRRSGWVQVDSVYNLNSSAGQNYFGVGFDYPEANVQSLRWLGDGPYRTYKNRRQGAMTNVWQNTYNNTATGGSLWVYPEFKGYYGNVRWAQLQTTEGPITAELGADTQFLQVFTPATISGQPGTTTVPYPSASLSILDAIPPMGSKFSSANTTGPAGQQYVASGTYTDSVSFYFGTLP